MLAYTNSADVGISSNLIGSLSLANGHCPPPGRGITGGEKQGLQGANSHFVVVTEDESFQNTFINCVVCQRARICCYNYLQYRRTVASRIHIVPLSTSFS